MQAAVDDSLPPGFIVQEAPVGSTNSVELFLVIAAVYRAIRDFNEVWETLVTARDQVGWSSPTLRSRWGEFTSLAV